ncbi:MAG: LytTR family transcriptional regulator [Bacteroidales bacterium]|nr:LytTR family transcriptional regulator [Bacteroidales bacterium]
MGKTNYKKQEEYQFFTHGKHKILIEACKVLYLQCEGKYTTIYLIDGNKILDVKNLKKFETELTEYGFLRIHHNTIINGKYITAIELSKEQKKVFLGEIELKISRNKAEFVKKTFF